MNIFKKKVKEDFASVVQTSNKNEHPFYELNNYSPLSTAQDKIYESLRESVPIIDSAIYKIVRLVGGFTVKTGSALVENDIKKFLENVNVNGTSCGFSKFMDSYFEQLLTYGTAVGEIVVDGGGNICAMYNASLDELELKRGENPIDVKLYTRKVSGEAVEIKYPQLVLFSVLNPQPGQLKGTSLLKGLPFVSSILLKIYNTIGINWDRVGNVRFAVTYKPQNDSLDKAFAKERATQIAQQWSMAMKSGSQVSDFVAVGDVNVKVIGADNQIMDSEIPVKQMLEQIVAKTGLPPFMLGLSWSTTERMSQQQTDILTSELEAYRRILTPMIAKTVRMFLALKGNADDFEIVWDDISLQDEVEQATARLYSAQAQALEKQENGGGED